MHTIKTTYSSNLRCQMQHLQSKTQIESDAPTDNNGKGERFSPTDLLSASLGACMITIMGIRADKSSLEMGAISCNTDKIMHSDPRRVGEIHLYFEISNDLNEQQCELLERAALQCPVAKSIHPDILVKTRFTYSNGRVIEYNKLG